MTELLPTKAAFALEDEIEIEVRGAPETTTLALWRLEELIAEVAVPAGSTVATFGRVPEGGYGVESADGARTALDVQREPLRRLRYGFVSDFAAGRDTEGVVDNVRRLHLNAVQFYDWMYRHGRLLPPQDDFTDPLGREVSLDTVRGLAAGLRAAGSLPLGYAAVYAVGEHERDAWSSEGLYRADGSWWMLADFLWIVDPTSPAWQSHFTSELAAAQANVGFAGFHLDQYGAPKRARRSDGTIVDLARAFPALIERVRDALPDAKLVFNNVNDFPTWSTARTRQDAIYIEVWPPHTRLDHLAGLVDKARALERDRPVSLAAYLSSYGPGDARALASMQLELATVFSHGATCLLHGEEDAILVDPYYVRHAHLDAAGVDSARRYYDFAVRYGDLLFDPERVEVTRTHLGGVNEEIRVSGPVPVATDCVPGAVWARAIRSGERFVVSLIDLVAQSTVEWDIGKAPVGVRDELRVSFQRVGSSPPAIHAASPGSPSALRLESTLEHGHDVVRVPAWESWTLVWADAQ